MAKVHAIQGVVSILWPPFIMAGIATIIFFTVFDPDILFSDHEISALGAYTIGFFIFWLFGSLNCMATCFLLKPCKILEKSDTKSAD